MTDNTNPSFDVTLPWQGFHHVAMYTADLDATIRFYHDVLGMQVDEVYEARGGKTRHCFIKPGATRSLGLHVWEIPGAQLPPAWESLHWQQSGTIVAGSLSHIAFALSNEEAALALRERLCEHNVQMNEIGYIGDMRNFVFIDNNGTMIETIWPKA